MAANEVVESPRSENGGSRPVPDPTVLTTQQLVREISALRDYINGQIAIANQRIDGIDTATTLRLGTISHIPNQIDEKVSRLDDVTTERFNAVQQQLADRTIWLEEKYKSIGQQFIERDTRSERESRDNKVAVDAAFAAQKEAASEQNKSNTLAITKSEVATTETINKLAELFKTTTDGLADKIDDQKDRLNRIETALATFAAATGGHTQGGTDSRAVIAWGIAAFAGLLGIAATAIAIISAVTR